MPGTEAVDPFAWGVEAGSSGQVLVASWSRTVGRTGSLLRTGTSGPADRADIPEGTAAGSWATPLKCWAWPSAVAVGALDAAAGAGCHPVAACWTSLDVAASRIVGACFAYATSDGSLQVD